MTNIEALDAILRLDAVLVYARDIAKKGVAPTAEQFVDYCNAGIRVLDLLILKMSEEDNIQPWELEERAKAIVEEHARLMGHDS